MRSWIVSGAGRRRIRRRSSKGLRMNACRPDREFELTDHQRRLGPPRAGQAFRVSIEFHCCLHEVLVDA